MIELRDYQRTAVDRIIRGGRRGLGFAATGLGKSTMIVEMLRQTGASALIITPTREITIQIVSRLRRHVGASKVGVEMATWRANPFDRVVVATIQTLRTGRFKKFAHRKFDFIIIDEAHHAHPFNTYEHVLSAWGMGTKRGKERAGKLVFLTATPMRTDGVGLGHFVDEIYFSYSARWGIENAWLVPPVVYGAVFEDMITEEGAVLDALAESDTPALAFVSSVRAIKDVVERCEHVGYRAAGVWGTQDRRERKAALDAFAQGGLDVIVAHNALTEGWDAPHIRTLILSRSTQSDLLYTQMIGRGLRPSVRLPAQSTVEERKKLVGDSDKPHLIVYDLVPSASAKQIVSVFDLIGKDPVLRKEKRAERERAEEEVKEKSGGIFELVARDSERVKKALFLIDVLSGVIEEDGVWWFPIGDLLGTYVDHDPLDIDRLPACYFVDEAEGKVIRYNFGGWCKRLGRPRREYVKVIDAPHAAEYVEKLFAKNNVTMPTRITKTLFYDAGIRPVRSASAEVARKVRAVSKIIDKYTKMVDHYERGDRPRH